MRNGTARHLADPAPLRRQRRRWAGVGAAALLVAAGLAWAGSNAGSKGGDGRRAAAPPATAARPGGASTSTTPALVATTAAKPAANGPKNLLANPSFENGTQGWRPLGKARLTRSTEATEGGWSLRILADPSAAGPIGIAVPDATTTKAHVRYHTNAWVRPSAPGATVTIGLREYHAGKPVPGANTLGWTAEGSGWRQSGTFHVGVLTGSHLALEIMARDLPPGGYLDVDAVVLHILPSQ